MTGVLSTYAEKKFLDHLLRVAAWTMPSVYAEPSTTAPGETGSGSTPPSGLSGRVLISDKLGAAGSRMIANNAAISWTPTANGSNISHIGLWDASSGGNFIGYITLSASKAWKNGVVFTLETGTMAMSVAAGSPFSTYTANAFLAHALGKAAYTQPTSLTMKLSTANPGDSGSGVSEPSDPGGYIGQTIAFGAAADGAAEESVSASSGAVTFGPSVSGFGPVTHAFVVDQSANMLVYWAPAEFPVTLESGDSINFASGAVKVRLD